MGSTEIWSDFDVRPKSHYVPFFPQLSIGDPAQYQAQHSGQA